MLLSALTSRVPSPFRSNSTFMLMMAQRVIPYVYFSWFLLVAISLLYCISPFLVGGADYTTTASVLRFQPCDRNSCLQINIVNDTILEGEEYFTIHLEEPQDPHRFRVMENERQIVIVDDDGTYVQS